MHGRIMDEHRALAVVSVDVSNYSNTTASTLLVVVTCALFVSRCSLMLDKLKCAAAGRRSDEYRPSVRCQLLSVSRYKTGSAARRTGDGIQLLPSPAARRAPTRPQGAKINTCNIVDDCRASSPEYAVALARSHK